MQHPQPASRTHCHPYPCCATPTPLLPQRQARAQTDKAQHRETPCFFVYRSLDPDYPNAEIWHDECIANLCVQIIWSCVPDLWNLTIMSGFWGYSCHNVTSVTYLYNRQFTANTTYVVLEQPYC